MSLDYEVYKEGGLLNDRYQKIEDISEGSYGYVSLAKDIERKKLVAVKYIFKLEKERTVDGDESADEEEDTARDDVDGLNSANSSLEKRVQLARHRESMISSNVRSRLSENICFEAAYEIEIQRMIGNEHCNIVKLLDFFDSYIILEYCSGGDLYEAIKGDLIPRKTKEVTHILTQIIEAIQYVHSKGIYHRDIKPENILISNLFDWTIKLSDWGLATTHQRSLDRSVGSERYMAPELFESNLDLAERKEPYQCDKVDVWSIGIVFLNIVFSKNPFSVANQTDKAFCYFAANREALFDVFSTMSLDFFQVLRHSLTIDPANRDLKKMRLELDNLSEYTLDDEYYNSLQDDDVAVYDEDARHAPAYVPPSSAPAPVSLPTPPTSSAGGNGKINQLENSNISRETDTGGQSKQDTGKVSSPITLATTSGKTNQKERARSVPKFKFRKRSHVQRNDSPNQNHTHSHYANGKAIKNGNSHHHNNFSYFNSNNNHNHKNYLFNDKPKIVKHSRKPLGIPTPNTYINNYFNDYHNHREQHGSTTSSSNDFNTRDFFTPPSVNNRYMEGIFSNNHTSKRNNNYNNNNNNNDHNSKHHYFPHIGTTGSKGKQLRRPSSGNRVPALKVKNTHSSTTAVSAPAYHSPGKYIPPNVRNHHVGQIQSHIPNISAVLGTPTYHEQYANTESGKNEMNKGELDDVLFTLEEADDFLRDINDLSLRDAPVPSHVSDMHDTIQNDLPDLLKSPEPPRIQINSTTGNPFASDILNGNNDSKSVVANQNHKGRTPEPKYKPGVYVPPHHRKSFTAAASANEATLSVGPNSFDYSTLLNSRRPSTSVEQQKTYQAPFLPSLNNHSATTTALQDRDVFAQTDNDAVLFSDDDSADEGADSHDMRTMFGPYTIYNNGEVSFGNIRAGRKSSTVHDEVVGSLEQYKNNWLMLQQQQD